jgi:hypothetical protein
MHGLGGARDAAADRTIQAALWMGGLAALLFWLPVVGPMTAGFVGGVRAGGVVAALSAALLPALAAAGLLLALDALAAPPVISAVVASGLPGLLLAASVPLALGAVLGGLASDP